MTGVCYAKPITDIPEIRGIYPRGAFVYRIRSEVGDLLYVGKARSLRDRWLHHARTKPWWPLVASIEYEEYPMDYVALDAERVAIKRECPRYNIRSRLAGHAAWLG